MNSPRTAKWIVALTDAGCLISDDEEFNPGGGGAEPRRIVAAYLGRRTTAA